MTGRGAALAAALAATLVAAGCADDGPVPSSRIAGPRLLAIAADPPVLGPGGATSLRALVVDGDGDEVAAAVARLTLRACSPWRPIQDPDRDCGPDASLPLALDGEVARLDADAVLARFPPPPDLDGGGPIGGGGDGGDAPPCPAAYPHVELAVVADATVPGDDGVTVRLTAIKRLRLTWVDDVVRTVPRISALLIDDVPVAPGTSPVAVDAGDEVVVAVRPAPDALDRTCDGAQPPARVLEPVRIHLYATAGDLGAASVDARHDAADVEQLDTTTYVAPMAGAAVLWAVAVDDDGGIGWARFDVAVR